MPNQQEPKGLSPEILRAIGAFFKTFGDYNKLAGVYTIEMSRELVEEYLATPRQDDKIGPARDSQRCHTREELQKPSSQS